MANGKWQMVSGKWANRMMTRILGLMRTLELVRISVKQNS